MVLITSVIDTYEEIEVSIVDVIGDFLTYDQDKTINLTLRGKLAELMVKSAPEVYSKYVVIEKGKMVLYVQLIKALYGCLSSELLKCRKILDDLESRGFSINKYDTCIVNKMVGGKQFTITWHVDDLKLSHIDKKVVGKIIKWMKSLYGQDMSISRGNKHDCLGMMLDFSVRLQVEVTIVDYLKGVISECINSPK